MNSLTRRSIKIAHKSAQAALDAAVTISARTSGLTTPGLDISGARSKEARLMVQEKVAAAVEGVLGAQMAWGSFWVKAAFGGVTTPHHVSHALVDIAEAAMAPAQRMVRANARRLTGMKAIG